MFFFLSSILQINYKYASHTDDIIHEEMIKNFLIDLKNDLIGLAFCGSKGKTAVDSLRELEFSNG